MKILLDESKELQDTLVCHRRYLHENPEIHLNLPMTTTYVLNKLKEIGYAPKEICKSGILAIAGGKKPGKTFLIRADMDALPIVEETDLPFKAHASYMHACGHDMHTAMLLGAAKLLKKHENEIEGTIKLMFQPAEETLTGAKNMIDAGILENPTVDAAMMIHVAPGSPFDSGMCLINSGNVAASASDWFKISVQGKGGHGASPQCTIDPLNIVSHIHLALQEINSRELAPSDTDVLTVGQIHGGNTSNVIPDTAYLSGTIRTFSKENRDFIKKRLEEISTGIAKIFRATATVEYERSCPTLVNNTNLVNEFKKYSKALLGDDKIVDIFETFGNKAVSMFGSEDFSYISELVPSVMVSLTTGSIKNGYTYPPHHPKVIFDESPLYIGAAIYANMAMEYLKNAK